MTKKNLFTLVLCLFCFGTTTHAQRIPTLEEAVYGGLIKTEGGSNVNWMKDGERYSKIEKNAEGAYEVTAYKAKDNSKEVLIPANMLLNPQTGKPISVRNFVFSEDNSKVLIYTNTRRVWRYDTRGDYWVLNLKDGKLQQLGKSLPEATLMFAKFSPDASRVAYVSRNNIYVESLVDGKINQLTQDGNNEIVNGTFDWVYEEEFAFNRALEFSPDSKMLAFIRFDEREVPSYTFPVFAGEVPHIAPYEKYPGEYTYKYPKTGEKNSKVSVHTFDIKSKVTRKINLPLEEGGYIPRIRFTQDPNKLAIMTLNRHQNRFDLYFADPRSTVCKLAVRDESDTYIRENVFDNIIFYPETFSFVSERSGYNHLYWYNINGNLIKQVTSGSYEVQDFLGYDPENGSFYYSSNEESPLRSAIYKIDRKGKKTKLSSHTGTNSALFSTDMKYFMNRYSSLDIPTVITLNDNNGKTLTTLVDNAALKQKLNGYDMPKKEFFSFQTSEGTELNGWMIKPANFSASKKYPVLMYQYSGPGSQQVLDKFGVSWETYMASQGYVIVCVDGRGTGGRGAEFAKSTYLNLGVKEAKDQVETALYLGRQPYVDKNRIGIWGWSYGGYMTIMSMSEGTPVFKAGAAVAPVTDWNYYDTVYGERFMRTPKENAEGYKASSAFTRANNLHGNLLLVHGMADDNVHFQNCAEYAEHLVQLGKQFDMQVYTNRNHSIFGGNTRLHLYTKLTNFFNRELKK